MIELTDKDFEAAESAGNLRLSNENKIAVNVALDRHRQAADYERSTGRTLVTDMKRQRRRAQELAQFLEDLDRMPGRLAQDIAARKGISAACEIKRLRDMSDAIGEFLSESANFNRKHKADRSVDVMLLDLQDIFLDATGGASTAVVGWESERHSRFVDFVNAVLRAIPREYRPPDVTSRWSTVRKLMKESGSLGWHNWFGSAVPALLRPTRPSAYKDRA